MRSTAILLICLLLAGAVQAEPKKPIQVVAPKPAAVGLRGPQEVTPPPAKPSPTQPTAPGLRLAAAVPPVISPAQCRQTCAHAYFFCLSGEGNGDCSERWTSCLAGCSRSASPLP